MYSAFIDSAAHIIDEFEPYRNAPKILLYADDMVLYGTNSDSLQLALDKLAHFATVSRFQFNISKCEVISNNDYIIGREILGKRKFFKYLGVIFDKDGIQWNEHYENRRLQALKRIFWFRELGFNGNGFSLEANSRIAKTFIIPVIEYGLQICPQKTKRKNMEKAFKTMIQTMVSFSKSCPIDTLCALSDIDSPDMRYEKLSFKFYEKTLRLSEKHFAVKDALQKHKANPLRNSVFYKLEENWYLRKFRLINFYRPTKKIRNVDIKLLWEERKNIFISNCTAKYTSSRIFWNKNFKELKLFRDAFKKINMKTQRLILIWVLNRRNPTVICTNCKENSKLSKEHIERCILQIESRDRPEIFSSRIEESINQMNFSNTTLLFETFEKVGALLQKVL